MKKLAWILVLAVLLLCGCALRETAAPPQDDSARSQSEASSASRAAASASVPPQGSAEISATQTRDALPSPAAEEVLYAYDRAVEAYGWFALSTLPSAGDMVEQDGCRYQRVDYDGISNLKELRTYLGDLFSQELIGRLLPQDAPTPLYRDIGDRLYVQPAARGASAHKGAVTTAVRQESAAAWSVNVTVEILGNDLTTVTGVEIDSFPYELTDGRWVFTDFYLAG